jgi:glyceraldehyde-3-phosphate dehydrogenase/erythrose-4-phosphate dehydrogenase
MLTTVTLLYQVIHENLKIKHGAITTIHDVTGTQPLVDMVRATTFEVVECVHMRHCTAVNVRTSTRDMML